MIEFSSVTTRGGDKGESSLGDGRRMRKDDPVFEALGELDALGSQLGVVIASGAEGKWRDRLYSIQQSLVFIGGIISAPKAPANRERFRDNSEVELVEGWEEEVMATIEVGSTFVLPGGTLLSAHTHVARTICRCLERRIVTLIREASVAELIPVQRYVNRLSDLLYLLARAWE